MLYTVTLQTGLIPAWLSVRGILGAAIAILANIFVWIKYLQIETRLYNPKYSPCIAGICFCGMVAMEEVETIMQNVTNNTPRFAAP